MTAEHERVGALEAIERFLNRGGDADDVLRDVLVTLFQLYAYVALRFVEDGRLVDGRSLGTRDPDAVYYGGKDLARYPVLKQGRTVARTRGREPGWRRRAVPPARALPR